MLKLAATPEGPLRTCKHCGVIQPLGDFPRAKSTSPGVYHEHKCKACYARRAKERYQSDPAHRAQQIARSMNASIARRTGGRVTERVNAEALAALILSASACAYCQGPLATFGYAVDHIIPLSRGGQHTLGNLAIACEPFKRPKGDLPADEFREWLAGVAARFSST